MPDLTSVKLSADWLDDTDKMLLARGDRPEMPLKLLPDLNRKTWGIHKKKLLVIGARPSNFKTGLALNVALDLAEQGFLVYFVSLEQPAEKLQERIFCIRHNVDNIDLLKGALRVNTLIQSEWKQFKMAKFHQNLIISDMIGRKFQDIDTVLSKMAKVPDALIIDHLQEIRGNNEQKGMIEAYIENMRASAIRNNYALILCSQVNRMSQAGDSREPQLHQLKSTGAIEEMADIVWLLHWEYHYSQKEEHKNKFQVNVAKNRDGVTGYIQLKVLPEYYKFGDWSGHSQTDLKTNGPVEKQVRKDWY